SRVAYLHYILGRALNQSGQHSEALGHLETARDLLHENDHKPVIQFGTIDQVIQSASIIVFESGTEVCVIPGTLIEKEGVVASLNQVQTGDRIVVKDQNLVSDTAPNVVSTLRNTRAIVFRDGEKVCTSPNTVTLVNDQPVDPVTI